MRLLLLEINNILNIALFFLLTTSGIKPNYGSETQRRVNQEN